MAFSGHKHANSVMAMQHYCTDEITTTTGVAQTILSIPTTTNTAYTVVIQVLAYKSDFSSMRGGEVTGTFIRGSGNIAKDGSIVNSLVGTLTGAAILMVANIVSQTIDVQVSGLAATVIWNIGAEITYNV